MEKCKNSSHVIFCKILSITLLFAGMYIWHLDNQNLTLINNINEMTNQIDSLKNVINNQNIKIDSLNTFINGHPALKWDSLVNAMSVVESGCNENAIGKNGSYGILQIRKILVSECNLILKSKNINYEYKHNDAFDKDKSYEMFHLIALKYCPEVNYEKMARIWNGGPNAYKEYIIKNDILVENEIYKKTSNYWKKIAKELSNNC